VLFLNIQDAAITQEKWNKDLDEFCSDEVMQSIIAYLDGGKGIRTKDYVIPKDIASYHKQISNAYLYKLTKEAGWRQVWVKN
jgi:hypothetical protein